MTPSVTRAENLDALRLQLRAQWDDAYDVEEIAETLAILTDALEAYGYPLLAEDFRRSADRRWHSSLVTVRLPSVLWRRLDSIVKSERQGRVLPEFIEHVHDTGGTKWPIGSRIQAYVGGVRAGFVEFLLSAREATARIDMIFVERDFRRQGIATALMDALHELHPRVTKYLTPEILPDGRPFFSRYRRQGRSRR